VSGPPASVRERIGRVRDRLDADGRDQSTLTTSLMTWCYVGATEAEAFDRIERARRRAMRAGKFDDELATLRDECVVGGPAQAIDRLREYEEAGVQRIMLNHELFDDREMLEVLATEIIPEVSDR